MPNPPVTISLSVTEGSCIVSPQGSHQDILVNGIFTLCKGDVVKGQPGSKGTVYCYGETEKKEGTDSQPSTTGSMIASLPVSAKTNLKILSHSIIDNIKGNTLWEFPSSNKADSPASATVSVDDSSLPLTSDDAQLHRQYTKFTDTAQPPPVESLPVGGNITPAKGLVFLKNPQWKSFVKVPHRSSFSYGAKINCEPMAKLEISTAKGFLIRANGPASIKVDEDAITLLNGIVLVQSKNKDVPVSLRTDETRMSLKGTLMILERNPIEGKTIAKVLNGILELMSVKSYKGEPWSTMVSANRELIVKNGVSPAPSVRFERNNLLTPFLEGWQVERANSEFPSEFETNELLSQLRADQAKAQRPPQANTNETPPSESPMSNGNKNDWLRLRMRSTEDPVKRRHFVTFKRYAKARNARERYQNTLDGDSYPGTDYVDHRPEAKGHVPGGKTRHWKRCQAQNVNLARKSTRSQTCNDGNRVDTSGFQWWATTRLSVSSTKNAQ